MTKGVITVLAIAIIASSCMLIVVDADYSTSQLRTLWAPACATSKFVTVTLPSPTVAKVTIDSRVAPYFRKMHDIMYAWNWDPPAASTGAYNCRQITGGTAYSLHAYGIAGDYDWNKNPYGSTLITNMPQGMIDEILAIRTTAGDNVFRWGGYYSGNKDAMHYEIIASPAQLASGISAGTCRTSAGAAGQCVHTSRCSTTGVAGLCAGTASVTCCTGQVNTKRASTAASSTGSSGGTTYGSCTAGGVTGVCRSKSSCRGITTAGLCPGSSDIQCCTTPTCTNHAGTCLQVSSCNVGYTFTGYCPGDSTIKCCTSPIQSSSAEVDDTPIFIIDEPFNSTSYGVTMVGDDDEEHDEGVDFVSAAVVSTSCAVAIVGTIIVTAIGAIIA